MSSPDVTATEPHTHPSKHTPKTKTTNPESPPPNHSSEPGPSAPSAPTEAGVPSQTVDGTNLEAKPRKKKKKKKRRKKKDVDAGKIYRSQITKADRNSAMTTIVKETLSPGIQFLYETTFDNSQLDPQVLACLQAGAINREHIPELIQVCRDRNFWTAKNTSFECSGPASQALYVLANYLYPEKKRHLRAMLPIFVLDTLNCMDVVHAVFNESEATRNAIDVLIEYSQKLEVPTEARNNAIATLYELGTTKIIGREVALQEYFVKKMMIFLENESLMKNDQTGNGTALFSMVKFPDILNRQPAILDKVGKIFERKLIDESEFGGFADFLKEISSEIHDDEYELLRQYDGHEGLNSCKCCSRSIDLARHEDGIKKTKTASHFSQKGLKEVGQKQYVEACLSFTSAISSLDADQLHSKKGVAETKSRWSDYSRWHYYRALCSYSQSLKVCDSVEPKAVSLCASVRKIALEDLNISLSEPTLTKKHIEALKLRAKVLQEMGMKSNDLDVVERIEKYGVAVSEVNGREPAERADSSDPNPSEECPIYSSDEKTSAAAEEFSSGIWKDVDFSNFIVEKYSWDDTMVDDESSITDHSIIDGEEIMYSNAADHLVLWNYRKRIKLQTIKPTQESSRELLFSRDLETGYTYVGYGWQTEISRYKPNGRLDRKFDFHSQFKLWGVYFGEKRFLISFWSPSGAFDVLDKKTLKLQTRIWHHSSLRSNCLLDESERTCVALENGNIVLYDKHGTVLNFWQFEMAKRDEVRMIATEERIYAFCSQYYPDVLGTTPPGQLEMESDRRKQIVVYQLDKQQPLFKLTCCAEIHTLSFSAQKDLLAVGLKGGKVELWSVLEGTTPVCLFAVQAQRPDHSVSTVHIQEGRNGSCELVTVCTWTKSLRVFSFARRGDERINYDPQHSIIIENCHFCGKWSYNTCQGCSGCRVVYYCSVKCQKKSWKQKHKIECKSLKKVAKKLSLLK